MMTDLVVQAAMAQDIGARHRQEDAVALHAPHGSGAILAVLSDGMGGHDDGDLASRIIAGEAFAELYLAAARPNALRDNTAHLFKAALTAANRKLQDTIAAGHLSDNTGGTMICVSVHDGQLRWLSVGDSLIYLIRGSDVRVLNALHSYGAQLDRMVNAGTVTAPEAQAHPDRACLTSAVTGRDIPQIDCPDHALDLCAGDVVVIASDGIETLDRATIQKLAARHKRSADTVASALIAAVKRQKAPQQDNTSVVVIRAGAAFPSQALYPLALHSVRATLGQWWHRLALKRLFP